MKTVFLELITSKKFLAALTAAIVYIAGRFGFDVDTATLDRVYVALLAYVGAQGIADHGKEAAKIYVGAGGPVLAAARGGDVGATAPQRGGPVPVLSTVIEPREDPNAALASGRS